MLSAWFGSPGCVNSSARAHTNSLGEINTTLPTSCTAVMPFATSLSVCGNHIPELWNSVLAKPGAACFPYSVSKQVKS